MSPLPWGPQLPVPSSQGLQEVAARTQPGSAGRDCAIAQGCNAARPGPGDEPGLIWPGVVLGPTLLWGEPEGWQLFSTLPGRWWHPGGQGPCGVMWLQAG